MACKQFDQDVVRLARGVIGEQRMAAALPRVPDKIVVIKPKRSLLIRQHLPHIEVAPVKLGDLHE